MTALKDYLKLKKEIERHRRAADRASGVLEQITNQLKNDFNCSTLKEAVKKVRLLKKQRQEAKMIFIREKEKFERKYSNEIDED